MATSGEGADPREERVHCAFCHFDELAIVDYDHDDGTWYWECPDCKGSHQGWVGE
ncbi:hypothetical protein [Plantibacter sp. YIM 135249]|uniref:hypothetical protein n=1 Tax=Plantibacter sp. YIM 135249 TaxID=3423918 RepID=UPI003D357974